MSPFHNNRPPIAFEPLTLGSGDIEAVEYAPRVPGFPPPPVARHAARPLPQPERQRQTTGHRVPSPSPSLAPVAMNAMRSRADSSGPQVASVDTIVIRSRPTMKMGFSILMAGIILGGVLGITTRTKPANAAYQPSVETVLGAAAAADDAKDDAPPPTLSTKTADSAKTADSGDAKTDATSDETKDTAKPGAKKKRGGGAATKATVASTAPKAAKERPEKASKEKDDDDGYRVASADPNAEREPAKTAKTSRKAAKVQDDDDDPPPAPAAKSTRAKPKASDDAVNVLKAAMGATENTL